MADSRLRTALDELVEADHLRLEADSLEAGALAYLAEHYTACDDVPVTLPAVEVFSVIGSEGTPPVSDFLVLELAAARGISTLAAAESLTAVLNLKYRHPKAFNDVLCLRLPLWIAKKVSFLCAELSPEACKRVDAEWSRRQVGLEPGRKFSLVKGLIAKADPELAAAKVAKAREQRYVTVGMFADGTMQASAKLDVLDGMYLDAATDRIADILIEQGASETKKVLRAKALGILATPARALRLMQSAMQPALSDEPHPDTQHQCGDRLCGAITVHPDKLLPKARIVLHIASDGSGAPGSVTRIEGVGALPTTTLNNLLTDVRVSVHPVVDLNEVTSVDRYEIPTRLRDAVESRHPYDAFPFSHRRSRGLDLDHTAPYEPGGPPGQTRLNNLAPLNRRAHRAKTSRAWTLSRDRAGDLVWESPLGYQYAVTPLGTFRVQKPIGRELMRTALATTHLGMQNLGNASTHTLSYADEPRSSHQATAANRADTPRSGATRRPAPSTNPEALTL